MKKKKYFKLFLLLSLTISTVTPPLVAFYLVNQKQIVSESDNLVHVSRIVDGDTFEDTKGNVYRLFGIDTLEMTVKTSEGRVPTIGRIRYWAEQATNKLSSLIYNQKVKVQNRAVDQYGRIVVTVFFNSLDISKELLKQGLAKIRYISLDPKSRFFTTDVDYFYEIQKIENSAKNTKIGIWS